MASIEYNEVFNVSCFPGYWLSRDVNSASMLCLANGEWLYTNMEINSSGIQCQGYIFLLTPFDCKYHQYVPVYMNIILLQMYYVQIRFHSVTERVTPALFATTLCSNTVVLIIYYWTASTTLANPHVQKWGNGNLH